MSKNKYSEIFRNHTAKLIYYMRAEHGYTYEQIGKILGISGAGAQYIVESNLKNIREVA